MVPPGTNFLINADPPQLVLQNMDSLWKIWTTSHRWKNVDPEHISQFHDCWYARFAFMWLVYSRNKFFRVGPNISEKFVLGGTNFRGIQIKCDRPPLLKSRFKAWSSRGKGFCLVISRSMSDPPRYFTHQKSRVVQAFGLCSQCSTTELQQPDNHQPSQSSICTGGTNAYPTASQLMVEHLWLNPGTLIDSWWLPALRFPSILTS